MASGQGLAWRIPRRERGRVTPELHQRAKSVFLAACGLGSCDRGSFLDEQCAGDPELRAAVDALLANDANPLGFGDDGVRARLEGLFAEAEHSSAADAATCSPDPERIGRYRIVRKLGEGGFGTVYEAEQTEPLRRRVALKVVKPGMDSRSVLAGAD